MAIAALENLAEDGELETNLLWTDPPLSRSPAGELTGEPNGIVALTFAADGAI